MGSAVEDREVQLWRNMDIAVLVWYLATTQSYLPRYGLLPSSAHLASFHLGGPCSRSKKAAQTTAAYSSSQLTVMQIPPVREEVTARDQRAEMSSAFQTKILFCWKLPQAVGYISVISLDSDG